MTAARVQTLKLSDQVTRILAARIVNGEIGVADQPPTEQDICGEFGVSKTTAIFSFTTKAEPEASFLPPRFALVKRMM